MRNLRAFALAAALPGLWMSAGCNNVAHVDAAAADRVLDTTAVSSTLNGDGEFQIAARYWTALVRLDVGGTTYDLQLDNGKATALTTPGTSQHPDVSVTGAADAWRDRAIGRAFGDRALRITGDRNLQVAPYQAAINRLVGVVSGSLAP